MPIQGAQLASWTITPINKNSTDGTKNDILWGAGKNCVVKGAILDDNVSVGDGCQIINKDGVTEADRTKEGYAIQDGIVTILRNAVIPSGTVI